jgi:small basic protein
VSSASTQEFDLPQDKSAGDLVREAAWFALHTLIAILALAAILIVMTTTHPDPDSPTPKLLATLLAIAVPPLIGSLIARIQQNHVAAHVWIAGLMFFAIVCVWVLGLPTGNGFCEKCGAMDKLSRTFFALQNGSGLLDGDGLLLGTWIPLSIISYSMGARLALPKAR